ncbi:hypothetical protein ACQKWADRAFT_329856 [Trichoderma austrokoningii]
MRLTESSTATALAAAAAVSAASHHTCCTRRRGHHHALCRDGLLVDPGVVPRAGLHRPPALGAACQHGGDDSHLVAITGGAANIQGGATMDMKFLNATVMAVVGGRNGGVGVGGLLLGGGISHFSPRVGWACDGVVESEVVLANGTLATVSASSHPDLYRALKGGDTQHAPVAHAIHIGFLDARMSNRCGQ